MNVSRTAVTVALLLLAALAGCNAPASDTETPEPTLTAAPIPGPTDTPSSDDLAVGEYPPGVTRAGVTAPGRLARAHEAALAGTSYAVNQTLVQRYPNGTVRVRHVVRGRFTAAPGEFRSTVRRVDRRGGVRSRTTVERYADGRRVYERVVENGTDRYRLARYPDGSPRVPKAVYPSNLTNRREVERLFSRIVTTTTDRGPSHVRVQSVGRTSLPPLENVTLTATVAKSGLVTAYQVTYDVRRAGRRVRVTVTVSYHDVGTATVERPDWVDRVNATDTEPPRATTSRPTDFVRARGGLSAGSFRS